MRTNAAEERYFEGLRARRLFFVAESYCLRRLAEPGLPPAERADLTIELSRTLADHATYRTGQEREELWRQAEEVVDDLLRDDPDNPRREFLELQAATVPALRGASLRWRVQLHPHDDRLRDQALLQLQSAVAGLQDVESYLAERARRAPSRTAAERADGSPTRSELLSLKRQATFLTAAAYLDLARVLPSGVNRTEVLHTAKTRLNELSRARRDDDIAWTSRLLRAEIARLQNDFVAANSLLESLERDDVPADIRSGITAERVRLLLARNRPDEALQRLLDYRRQHGGLTDELAALNVEALLKSRELAQQRDDDALAADLLAEAERLHAGIGPPWDARSRTLLQAAADAERYGPELAPLILSAQAAWQNGDIAAASERYGDAVEQAEASGRGELAMELLSMRATLQLQAGAPAKAAEGFREVAERAEDPEQAARAHLMSAYCLGKVWEQEPSDSRRDAYVAALEEHRRRFSDRPSAVEATWMLAAFLDSRGERERAIGLYGRVPSDHPRAEQARARTAVLFDEHLAHLRETGQSTAEWEDRAVSELTEFVESFPTPPRRLNRLHAEVAVRLAAILLTHRRPRYADAEALLDRVRQSYDVAAREAARERNAIDAEWTTLSLTAGRLQILALAGQQRAREAQLILERLTQTEPAQMLAILSGLSEIAVAADSDVRRDLADLQLQAADRLQARRDELDAASRWLLDETRAEAYEAAGRPHDALNVYESMLQRRPRDPGLVRKCAELLASTGDEDELAQSYDYWRRLVDLEQQGSREWLEARCELAAVSLELGRVEEARKLVGVTLLLYRDRVDADLRQRYDLLRTRIDAAANNE